MLVAKDAFRIDIVLRHSIRDPADFSQSLSLEPTFSWKRGDKVGSRAKQSTIWQARLVSGIGMAEYEEALQMSIAFLVKNADFFSELTAQEGEAELILNHHIEQDEGKVLELYLHPSFLNQLANLGIGLRVQAWSGKVDEP